MGKPGSVVAKVPVILSKLKVSFPITFQFTLDENCILNEENSIKSEITNTYLCRNDDLILCGFFEKTLYYNTSECSSCESKIIKTPIEEKFPLKFITMPNFPVRTKETIFTAPMEPICCNINSIELLKDTIVNDGNNYKNTAIISIDLSISQIQNVFIAEPECDAVLLEECSPHFMCDDFNYYSNYEVGYNPTIGVIVEEQKCK